ncbi:hypothetical protein V2J09_018541 [Rumex salicifolius]
MAQLPPKIPAAMSPNWPPAFAPFSAVPPPANSHQPPWAGDFLDFAAAPRGSHRRSVSDSMAFLDTAPFLHSSGIGFDRIDDDQLISMFSDDLSGGGAAAPAETLGPSSSPSSPSDQDSNGDDKMMEAAPEPVNAGAKSEPVEAETCSPRDLVDPKRVKRILANRQSAQRSRVRKLQYISELERSVTTLQTEVSALSPRVAYLDHQRLLLNVDNSSLKQRLAALAQDKIFKDAHQEALKKEIERLRQKFHQQSMKKMGDNCSDNTTSTTQVQAAMCTGKEQLITS